MRVSIVVAILAFWFFAVPCGFEAFAQTPTASPEQEAVDIGKSLIDPTSPLYFLKTAKEYIENKFFAPTTDASKVVRQMEFAQRRLREVNSLISGKRQDLVVPLMEQYRNYLNLVVKIAPDKENIMSSIAEIQARHLDVLMRLYDQVGEPAAKRAIRVAILDVQESNRNILEKNVTGPTKAELQTKISPRQKMACDFLSREASSSALNDTERFYFSTKAKECQK